MYGSAATRLQFTIVVAVSPIVTGCSKDATPPAQPAVDVTAVT